jgi:hypothetical protein
MRPLPVSLEAKFFFALREARRRQCCGFSTCNDPARRRGPPPIRISPQPPLFGVRSAYLLEKSRRFTPRAGGFKCLSESSGSYVSLTYSALACFRIGVSRASFLRAKTVLVGGAGFAERIAWERGHFARSLLFPAGELDFRGLARASFESIRATQTQVRQGSFRTTLGWSGIF